MVTASSSRALSRWRRAASGVLAGGLLITAAAAAARTEQMAADRDNDGIPDCRERAGLRIVGAPTALKTDASDADTDGDGVADGSEVSVQTPPTSVKAQLLELVSCRGLTYVAWSDPTLADTDDDQLDDAVELSEGSDPYAADSDGDDLDDADEREWGSDPDVADTDADGFPDGRDIEDGSSPIVFDEAIDDEEWHSEYARGVGLGEFDDIDSVPQLLGALSGSISGSIPIIGWALSTVGDLRDAIAGIVNDDWSAVLTSAAAVLPFAGDSAKASKQITTFVAEHPHQLRRVVKGILALEKLPASVQTTLLRAADKEGVDGLRGVNLSDDVIIKFARRGTTLATLVMAADKASQLIQSIPETHTDDEGFITTLPEAQAALRTYAAEEDEFEGVDATSVYVDAFPARQYVGGRLVDACTGCATGPQPGTSTLRIAKLGSLHYSEAVGSQVDKDAYLIDQGFKVEWHFFAGPTGWTVDAEVLEALETAGIAFLIHIPS